MASTIAQHSIGHKNIEGDDLSLVSRKSLVGGTSCAAALFRVVLALLFIGLGVGALVYSVSRTDDSNESDANNANLNEMQPFRDQSSKTGTFTVVNRKNDSTNSSDESHEEYDTTTVSSQWYQDNTNRRLLHIIGEPIGMEVQIQNFITEVDAYQVTIRRSTNTSNLITHCDHIPHMNYVQYITQFGLAKLAYVRKETLEINNQGYDVIKYSGDPAINYQGSTASVMFSYASQTNYVMLGWETFFDRHSNNASITEAPTLYRTEFWFGDMTPGLPDPELLHFPPSCIAPQK
uniref:Uncharacterized protein n=1 Tax=Plectus sambesii TaxID=2011161 RepID=A0A914UPH1_9BILA